MYFIMLCLFLRNGLNMLVGGVNGGFSLKFFVIGNLDVIFGILGLWNLLLGVGSERMSMVFGGGFIEFYRFSVFKIWLLLLEIGLWFVSDDIKVNGEGREFFFYWEEIGRIFGKVGFLFKSDVINLLIDVCWRLIFKFGKYEFFFLCMFL